MIKKVLLIFSFCTLILVNFTRCQQDSVSFRIEEDPLGEEILIKDWHLKFNLPSKEWSFSRKIEQNNITMYLYSREALVDSLNRKITPGITIAFEKIDPDWDVIEYSAILRSNARVKWQIDDVFTHEDNRLSLLNAIGY